MTRIVPDRSRQQVFGRSIALGVVAFVLFGTSVAWGAVTINCVEVGPDVTCSTPGGPLSLAGLTLFGVTAQQPIAYPSFPTMILAPPGTPATDVYTGATGPTNFGTGGVNIAPISSGAVVGVAGDQVRVANGYTGPAVGPASMTFSGATFASLGMTSGTYDWTWPGDSVTLVVGPLPAVPAVSTAGLMALVLAALGLLAVVARRRRAATH